MRKHSTISKIETFRNPEYPRVLWVQLTSSEGITGMGETAYEPAMVETWMHESAAPRLLGENSTQLDRLWRKLHPFGGRIRTRCADLSGLSAIDMALWDLQAKRLEIPLFELLGGLSRDRIRVYNTCAGPSYAVKRSLQPVWDTIDSQPGRAYEDQKAFMVDAGALADSLLEDGYTAMKIWPFDRYAVESGGQFISQRDLEEGLKPFRLIRERVGNRMDIMVELHSLWNLPSAVRIAKALEPFEPFWFEDPVPADNIDALAAFARSTRIATLASETVGTRWAFREMFEKQALSICMLDVSWAGGISEARRIAAMAETYHVPVTPHDCVGPVTLMFSLHLALNVPNALILETVRAFNATWYKEIVTSLPRIEGGFAYPPDGTGCGLELSPELLEHKNTTRRVSEL